MAASTKPQTFANSVELLNELRQHEAQVRALRVAYSASMAPDAMLYWLAEAAREMRVERDCMAVDVAFWLRRSESTVSRFENHKVQPSDVDATVAAYARALKVRPVEIWAGAVERWRSSQLSAEEEVDRFSASLEDGEEPDQRAEGPQPGE